jgi:hypothetical protein
MQKEMLQFTAQFFLYAPLVMVTWGWFCIKQGYSKTLNSYVIVIALLLTALSRIIWKF